MDKVVPPCCVASRPQEAKEEPAGPETGLVRKSSKGIRFKEKMVLIEGGEFWMGSDSGEGHPADFEDPVRNRRVDPFYMDSMAVTNEEFGQFVKETGYRTEAERFGWSFVFYQFLAPGTEAAARRVANTPWWCAVEEAFWFQPEGAGSSIGNRMDHPVVHVSWHDAAAYCRWAGKRLPNETEWEYAARGGLEQKRYPWGDELNPGSEHRCNIWQGEFPALNTEEDGYAGTAPAASYRPNGFGLYNMAGNVWEWCANAFAENAGPLKEQGMDAAAPDLAKAMRGGSYLCHESYCNRYRVAARSSNTPDSSAGNIGFRCAVSI
ncbi:formylglycine-generating enzyme family protein [Planococcus sp. FY231025]|uniref:formylglycine-generating enzyme family protein n=1 Tax=Planococcus sp. FY231025 TaxID=3455699 RepID=UPI003F92AC86